MILKIPLFPDFPNCPPAGLHTLCDYSTAAIVTAFDWNTTYWPRITSSMLHHSAQYRNNNSTLVLIPPPLPHGRQPPRNYLVFVPEIPLAAHLSDPNTLLCVSIRLQCRALQMGWNVSSILLGRVIWFTEVLLQYNIFSVFWCRVVVFSELCNNAILPV